MSENTTTHAAAGSAKKSRFVVFYKDAILSVRTKDIASFSVADGTVCLFTLEGKRYPVRKTIAEIRESVDAHQFFQISRSAIVSYDAIERVEAFFGQRAVIFLKPSGKALVTKGRLAEFLSWLDE
jgi:two-component system, LytTR family, response regulator LytT